MPVASRRRVLKLAAAGAIVAALPLPAEAEDWHRYGWPHFGGKGKLEAFLDPETGSRIVMHTYRDGLCWGLGFVTTRRAMKNPSWLQEEAKHVRLLKVAVFQGLEQLRHNKKWIDSLGHSVGGEPTDDPWFNSLIPMQPEPLANA